MKKFYTIGYGGRKPGDFIKILKEKGIKAIVDIRLRPDRASMGFYAKAKSPEEQGGKLKIKKIVIQELKTKIPEIKLSELNSLENKDFRKQQFIKTLKELNFNDEEIKVIITHSQKGIKRIFEAAGIEYHSFIELGNVFLDFTEDWRERCEKLLSQSGELLTERLSDVSVPLCLMCSEKKVVECHREQLADYLVEKRGWELIEHIE